MITSAPVYQYVVVSDLTQTVQYDWRLYHRDTVILTCKGVEVPLPSDFIGKVAGTVLPKATGQINFYFVKPR